MLTPAGVDVAPIHVATARQQLRCKGIHPRVKTQLLTGDKTAACRSIARSYIKCHATHWYLKGGFVREYSAGLIELLAESRPDASTTMYFQSANGAVADVPPTATAFSHRGAIANMMLFGVWKDASQDEPGRNAIRGTDGYYVNLHDTDARDKGADSNYGANFTRLAALKRQFDPMNLFHLDANIRPAESAGRG